LAERRLCKADVTGSIPATSIIWPRLDTTGGMRQHKKRPKQKPIRRPLSPRPNPAERRRVLWEAYRGRCALCGERLALEELTYDHIRPRSAGGPTHPKNLQPAHARCNNRKGSLTMGDWLQRRRRAAAP
jgi:5-methylcytosine-specific restriction endonuclease McrA